ncbi:MAG: HAMP domain-containing sensor histidine kinase [Clostridiales bacterium]|nr:HAMP domain-containing sensor histidine kinase [Clostridiales bacterium]
MRKGKRTLRFKMSVVIVLALIISVLAFFAGRFAFGKYVSSVYMSSRNTSRRASQHIQDFAAYVTSHSIRSTDSRALRAWQEKNDNVYIMVYNNSDIVFDSDWVIARKGAYKYVITNSETGETIILIQDAYGTVRKLRRKGKTLSSDLATRSDSLVTSNNRKNNNSGNNGSRSGVFGFDVNSVDYDFYPVLFKDGVFDVCIVDYSDDTLKEIGNIVCFIMCSMLFIGIIIFYFGQEIARIRKLTNEVMDIKEVDLNGIITISGDDEICSLAENIDDMRETIIEQLSREKEAWQANSNLVTAMAHDIRTPLTVMAGYLELMKNKEYSTQEELDEYIRISSEKAEQLRTMSDKMFRYFYVYSKGGDELRMETFPAGPFLEQMLGEYAVLLGEKGYKFNIDISDKKAEIRVDVQGIKRIIDNVFTNIRKYSDIKKPIDVRMKVNDGRVDVYFRNYISTDRENVESTRIGTLTCRKMAEEMGGVFDTCEKGRVYEATLTLPNILSKDDKFIAPQGLTSILSGNTLKSSQSSATAKRKNRHK